MGEHFVAAEGQKIGIAGADVDRLVRHAWAASIRTTARPHGHFDDLIDRLIVPSTFETAVMATNFVRGDSSRSKSVEIELIAVCDWHPADFAGGACRELLPGDDVAGGAPSG